MVKRLQLSFLTALLLLTGITQAQVYITTYAGIPNTGDFYGDGGPAIIAAMQSPSDVVVDKIGNLYVADFMNNAVRKIDTFGVITTVAGNGSSTGGYTGDGGPATAARLNGPFALAIDKMSNLYIADGYNHIVRKITASTGIITKIAGTQLSAGYSGDGGPAVDAKLNNPVGLALDTAGNLYIADDHNNVIRKVDLDGKISTFAGDSTAGYAGNGGPATDALLDLPLGVAFDSHGNLYIADANNNAVRKVSTDGIMTTYAGSTDTAHGYSGDGGPATSARLYNPARMVFDAADNMYISDAFNSVIRKVTPSGTITTFAGTGMPGFSGDGGTPDTAMMNATYGVAIDQKGVFFVADRGNHVIRRIGPYVVPAGVGQVNGSNKGMSVYPNPVKGSELSVNINADISETATLTITNVLGKVVRQQQVMTKKPTQIKMDVPAGMYIINATTAHGNWTTEIVVE